MFLRGAHGHLLSLSSIRGEFCYAITAWHIICSCCDLVDNCINTLKERLKANSTQAETLLLFPKKRTKSQDVTENTGEIWKTFISTGWPPQHCWNSRGYDSATVLTRSVWPIFMAIVTVSFVFCMELLFRSGVCHLVLVHHAFWLEDILYI